MIDHNSIVEASLPLILSASGWRKVFAVSGDEEDTSPGIQESDAQLVAVMAAAFRVFLERRGIEKGSAIAVGSDSRPTGPSLTGPFIRYFISSGYRVFHVGVSAAPEIMAYTRLNDELTAFVYLSASHNPVGHNGVKFGLADGGVIGGGDAAELIALFRELLASPRLCSEAVSLADRCDEAAVQKVSSESAFRKRDALGAYRSFLSSTVTGSGDAGETEALFTLLRSTAAKKGFGVLGELNGSARAASIDKEILKDAGFETAFANDVAGEISHRIVPEGESLEPACRLLEGLHRERPGFVIAYVPDNDGDRGNIVYIRENGRAAALEAQEVFALAVLSELAFSRWLDDFRKNDEAAPPLAVAVNGPTSMRIDRIAEAFSAAVFRAEVGEANVVNLARELREKGYRVPILGEGSNGGNITHPSSVRDPLCTVFAIAKLLLIRDRNGVMGLYRRWLEASGQTAKYREDYTLVDIIGSLPPFTTTSAYEERAVLRLGPFRHTLLKTEWERLFEEEWELRKDSLYSRFGITGREERQFEGTAEKQGAGARFRTGEGTGGLKVLFFNAGGRATDCIWMRGSGTEPVFRIMADCEGADPGRERYFLDWHRSMIEAAYRAIE